MLRLKLDRFALKTKKSPPSAFAAGGFDVGSLLLAANAIKDAGYTPVAL